MKNLYKKRSILLAVIGFTLFLFSCQKDKFINNLLPDYVGTDHLSQTEWIITRYDNTLTNLSEFPNDTIYFVDSEKYRING
jgi:membrane-associated PAP2 superfamily phosphatase